MKIFSAKLVRWEFDLEGNVTGYWLPTNPELQDFVLHDMGMPQGDDFAATLAAYLPTAARAMFDVVDAAFPGEYQLDEAFTA